MFFRRRIARLLTSAALCAFCIFPAALKANASDVQIDENSVVSLAGTPFVTDFRGEVDAAGRASISLDLTFINPCVRDAGIVAKVFRSTDDRPDIVVLQRIVSQDGCPDIASPVDERIRVLLPSGVIEKGVYLVSRPWRSGQAGSSTQPLSFSSGASGAHDKVIEAQFVAGVVLAPVTVDGLAANASNGYVIAGRIGLGDCSAMQAEPILYEVPDPEGSPVADILIITVPERCTSGQTDAEIRISVPIPFRGIERTVTVFNETNPEPRPIR